MRAAGDEAGGKCWASMFFTRGVHGARGRQQQRGEEKGNRHPGPSAGGRQMAAQLESVEEGAGEAIRG